MHVQAKEGITLVGTAHVSKTSVKEVRKVIKDEDPQVVAVELCQARYQALKEKKKFQATSLTTIIKQNKMFLVLVQILLSMIQRTLSQEGLRPGAEMIAAMRSAKKLDKEVELVDRDITITLKRAWANMGIIEKIKLFFYFYMAIIGFDRLKEETDKVDIEKMADDSDLISMMMDELRKVAPSTTKTLIDERDAYLAKKILDIKEKEGKDVVAVIGAGHVKGVLKYIKKPSRLPDLKDLEVIPKKRVPVLKIIAWAIPLFIISMFLYVFIKGDWQTGIDMFIWWVVINGVLAALGAILAWGHPVTWVVAFVAAPFTSLNPLIGAGWVAGYVEAVLHTPRVKDLEGLATIETMKDFYKNRFVKVLLVAALVNLGSSIGTFVVLPYLVSSSFF